MPEPDCQHHVRIANNHHRVCIPCTHMPTTIMHDVLRSPTGRGGFAGIVGSEHPARPFPFHVPAIRKHPVCVQPDNMRVQRTFTGEAIRDRLQRRFRA